MEKIFDCTYNWENKIILVAKDEEINAFYIEKILSNTGLIIYRAKDSKETIDKFSAYP